MVLRENRGDLVFLDCLDDKVVHLVNPLSMKMFSLTNLHLFSGSLLQDLLAWLEILEKKDLKASVMMEIQVQYLKDLHLKELQVDFSNPTKLVCLH